MWRCIGLVRIKFCNLIVRLLEDGKLCFTTGDSLDAEEADAETEEDDDSMDWTIKVYFDKLVVE